ncbi:MAG TPA: bifunctional adenosylcobinamide kinase/adenosylcobinamide-phosphate guanylyltransferase [Segeticoccus sp.]|uniref:bifunctional adenosylcobinamide kinase/adenosylcobinamide-phosphate guanylyltransferase n=1 Tax=Segeticoccus sp. TaxID=2706531 RepID=UPI002D80FE3A|nr:bifunctional adenosylcobinamide kinase/adenosylcobinamide-phosphate guanylyltransferase [Segeticoccus sp.]HET8600360.1 bifunctional adenosylcobinamide kinase/adenosylcobinamide-phosphate guanylyltransferase [Segeticoccus sp.]
MTRTLVLGGARSGKSRHAEALLARHDVVTYVAPGPPVDDADPEWRQRVERHRARRPHAWRTAETGDVAAVLRTADSPVLVDCLATWLTRVVDDVDGWRRPDGVSAHVAERTEDLLAAWRSAACDVVAVTNEVGMAVVPATASGRLFRDELGRLNAAVSAASERVHLVVAGRVLDLSACPVVGP